MGDIHFLSLIKARSLIITLCLVDKRDIIWQHVEQHDWDQSTHSDLRTWKFTNCYEKKYNVVPLRVGIPICKLTARPSGTSWRSSCLTSYIRGSGQEEMVGCICRRQCLTQVSEWNTQIQIPTSVCCGQQSFLTVGAAHLERLEVRSQSFQLGNSHLLQ